MAPILGFYSSAPAFARTILFVPSASKRTRRNTLIEYERSVGEWCVIDTNRIEVTTQVIGETDASLQMMPVWVELTEDTLVVAEIIASAVETQVNELLYNCEVDLENARRILNRPYMSQEDIEAQIQGRL